MEELTYEDEEIGKIIGLDKTTRIIRCQLLFRNDTVIRFICLQKFRERLQCGLYVAVNCGKGRWQVTTNWYCSLQEFDFVQKTFQEWQDRPLREIFEPTESNEEELLRALNRPQKEEQEW